ncbi:winged helix-turn-helix transcriptional regulator [Metabacillus bambusae]|uniref:Winged helix-turn-helix transcriptional regulator n=1 Tax=Metabacillus bambusae TaxID=2795218 RepID=A0ABS3NAN2_9BACI|nr:winged helix-turn-helix transcriptional regulator [Metabacillus bambusae]MBO1515283.1 winged helix-turn-helix transcriptional regulator [Metabacillus bambusae]
MVKYNTGINIFMNIVGGRWKCLILFFLSQKAIRTKEFYELMPGITQKVLTEQLKQLERDGLVHREVYKEVPPKVEYSLTELGKTFVPVLNTMCEWGNGYAIIRDINQEEQICCNHEER